MSYSNELFGIMREEIKTARLLLRRFRESDCDDPDEANGTTHVSVNSKEDWLSEIGAEVINQQKEGLQDGI